MNQYQESLSKTRDKILNKIKAQMLCLGFYFIYALLHYHEVARHPEGARKSERQQ